MFTFLSPSSDQVIPVYRVHHFAASFTEVDDNNHLFCRRRLLSRECDFNQTGTVAGLRNWSALPVSRALVEITLLRGSRTSLRLIFKSIHVIFMRAFSDSPGNPHKRGKRVCFRNDTLKVYAKEKINQRSPPPSNGRNKLKAPSIS